MNNLGAVSQAEMLIVRKCVADFLYRPHGNVLNGKQYRIHMFSGSYMTSLEMNGISVSCMLLSSEKYQMEDLLLASTACTAWIPSFPLCEPAKRPTSTEYAPEQEKTFSGVEQDPTGLGSSGSGLCDQTEKNIITITEALLGYSNRLGELDRRTGDGDLGDTGTL